MTKVQRGVARRRPGSARMLLEAIEPRYHLSADTSLAALRAAFTGGNADRVSSDLLTSYLASSAASKTQAAVTRAAVAAVGGTTGEAPYVTDAAGRVGVVITAKDPGKLLKTLGKLGVQVAASLQNYHRIEAFLPLAALPAISALGGSGLLGITPVYKPAHRTGTVNSQADNVLEADRVRASVPGYNGAGVKIGVLSDSYNKYTTSPASTSISTGNLPSNVQVLQDYTSGTDEGRAMLELIYDVAPGAQLGFATADISESGFASNIRALASNGYKVIVDDVAYFDEPYFQDGIVAQAVNDVVAGGAAYFSAAGNEGNLSYDTGAATAYGSATPSFASQIITPISSAAASYLDFNPSSSAIDTQMSVTIPRGSGFGLGFQWDQPFYTTSGVTTNLDFYLVSTNSSTGVRTVVASSTTNNVSNQTPYSLLQYTNNLTTAVSAVTSFDLVVRNTNGGPNPRVKFVDLFGDDTITYNEYFTYSSTIVGHAAAAGAAAVGAAPFFQQNTPESFSSQGPSTILFNVDGTRKATPEVRAGPAFLSIDGTDTSFFYPGDDFDGNGLNNFFGTSAAAPHAAAVAALVLQANPTFTPAQVYARLKSTADLTNLTTTNPNVVGAGLINAYRAVFGSPVATGLIYSDGFESGALGKQWQVNKQGSGYAMVTTTLSPASGADQLVLGQDIGYGTTTFTTLPGLAESTLHLNLAGQPGVTLSFSEKEFANETDNAMPASFTNHGNYDGVSFSVDGVTWYRLVSLTGASSTTAYQTQSVNLSAAAAALGITLTADTQVKFQEYNPTSSAIGFSGIALDNVVVSALSSLTSIVIDSGTVQRSRVRSITLNVLGTLASVPAAAFTLKRTGDNLTVPVTVSSVTNPTAGTSKVVLTFGGPSVEYGSLADGNYALTIDGSQLRDNANRAVDVDADGIDGGTRVQAFYRLFADGTGDRAVTIADFNQLAASFNATAAQSIFNADYDYNDDGVISIADFNQLASRFNATV